MNNTPVNFTRMSNTQLQIIALPGVITPINITVLFDNGTSDSLPYNYVNSPSITFINPSSGPITGLASTSVVYFNNIPSFNFVITSDAAVQVVVTNLTGQLNVLVHVDALGGSSNSSPYDIIPPPMI